MRKLVDWLLDGGLLAELRRVLAGEGSLPVAGELLVPLIVTSVAAIGLAYLGRALAARSARGRTWVLALGFTALATALWTFSISVQHHDYPYHTGWAARLIYTLPCVAAAALGTRVRAPIRLALALTLAGLAVADPAITAVHGLYMHARGGRTRDGIVIQSSPVTCAPAAMANLLRAWSLEVGEGDLALALRTTIFRGTSLPSVPANATGLGIRASYRQRASFADLERLGLPVILGTFHKGHRPHAVALLGLREGRLAVADPALGLLCAALDEYRAFSGWQGEAVIVESVAQAASRPSLASFARWEDCPLALPDNHEWRRRPTRTKEIR